MMSKEEAVVPQEARPFQTDTGQANNSNRIPQYRRDILPSNLLLSMEDLRELFLLVENCNEKARGLELAHIDLSRFESRQHAEDQISQLMLLEYNLRNESGDTIQGTGRLDFSDPNFPEHLKGFFLSNASYAKRMVGGAPLNAVELFLSFDKPTLKLDLLTLPSNPTENRSVINVYGRDEGWVVATAEKVSRFLDSRKTFRPVIHGSGTYDYFTYFVFLPAVIWMYFRFGDILGVWLRDQSVFFNVVLAIYSVLFVLLGGRFIFQYIRWLFPPMEFYKRNRTGAFLHRLVFGAILSTAFLSAVYDGLSTLVANFLHNSP